MGVLLGVRETEGHTTDTTVSVLGLPADSTALITRKIISHGSRGVIRVLFPRKGAKVLSDGRGASHFNSGPLLSGNSGDNPGSLRGMVGVIVQLAVPLGNTVFRHLPFLLGPEEGEPNDTEVEVFVDPIGFGMVSGRAPGGQYLSTQMERKILNPSVGLVFRGPFDIKVGAFISRVKEKEVIG